MTRSAAVVLTHNRPELLRECVAAITSQVDVVIVIDNASDPPARVDGVTLIAVPDQPPNLSRLWNLGIDTALKDDVRYVAFLCDDALVPRGWFGAVISAMRRTGAVVGCSNPRPTQHPPRLKTEHDSDLDGRMPGWAFVLDLTSSIRADERLHWWWCDTAIDWMARHRGGMVMISGYLVPNRRPDEFLSTVPGLHDRAGRDGLLFAELYNGGKCPW